MKIVLVTEYSELAKHAAEIKDLMDEGYKDSSFKRSVELKDFVKYCVALHRNESCAMFLLLSEEESVEGIAYVAFHPDLVSSERIATEIMWRVSEKGKGWGVQLFKEMEKWAVSKGCKKLYSLALNDKNKERVINLHERLGFKLQGYQFVKEY